jgi:hypothetical protein
MDTARAQAYILERSIPEPNSGCWLWLPSCTKWGYGAAYWGRRKNGTSQQINAHRLSYKAFVGPVDDDLDVCHTCDLRPCVNPDHLFSGTRTDNLRDMERKLRGRRGSFPVGVRPAHNSPGRFTARGTAADRKTLYLGTFDSIEEAASVAAFYRTNGRLPACS